MTEQDKGRAERTIHTRLASRADESDLYEGWSIHYFYDETREYRIRIFLDDEGKKEFDYQQEIITGFGNYFDQSFSTRPLMKRVDRAMEYAFDPREIIKQQAMSSQKDWTRTKEPARHTTTPARDHSDDQGHDIK